jgi:NAD(P)-dependent dehydrogenase (short-subunit alcohol dehydrogenase family)
MELKNTVALVTGGNRGLGPHLAAQLVEREAKVYVAVRPSAWGPESAVNARKYLLPEQIQSERRSRPCADETRRRR